MRTRLLRQLIALSTLAVICVVAGRAFAHAAHVQLLPVTGVELFANFDSGEPMAGAQVRVYAPDAPAKVWAQGLTDQAGVFRFVPDSAIAGGWVVQVRQAGHGAMGEIFLAPEMLAATRPTIPLSASSSGPDLLQKAMMAAAIIWGFVGTALYFKRPGARPDRD